MMVVMPVVVMVPVMAVMAVGGFLNRRFGMRGRARDQRGGIGRHRGGERKADQKSESKSEAIHCGLQGNRFVTAPGYSIDPHRAVAARLIHRNVDFFSGNIFITLF